MEGLKRYDFLTQIECDTIVNEILSLEDAVKRLGPDTYGEGTSEDSLTGRYEYFNYLNIRSINTIICPKLKEIFGPCVVQCWANIFRQGEGIDDHKHIYDEYYKKFGLNYSIYVIKQLIKYRSNIFIGSKKIFNFKQVMERRE